MDWQLFYDRITFSHYPFSPLHFVLWGFPLVLLVLLFSGLASFFQKKQSVLTFAAESSLLGGSLLLVAQIVSFYLGNSRNNVGWVIVPAVFVVSFISSVLARERKFLSGFLTGLMTLAVVLTISFPFILLVGFLDISRYGLIGYLGVPASVAVGYLWLVFLYPFILLFLAPFSLIGSFLNKNGNYQTSLKRGLISLVVLVLLSLSAFAVDSVLSASHINQQNVAEGSIMADNFQEKLVLENDKRVLEFSFDLTVPSEGQYKASASTLSYPGTENTKGAYNNNSALYIQPKEIFVNGLLVRNFGGYFDLKPSKNNIVFKYVPKKRVDAQTGETIFLKGGPYEIKIRVIIGGSRGVPDKTISVKDYITQPYSQIEFENN